MQPTSIHSLLEFLQSNFNLLRNLCNIKDNRKKPRVPTIHVLASMIFLPFIPKSSFNKLDILLRHPKIRKFFNIRKEKRSKHQHIVCSDSTMTAVLGGINPDEIRGVSYATIGECIRKYNGLLVEQRIEGLKGKKICAVDGTFVVNGFYSAFCIAGETPVLVDAEPFEKLGRELPTSRRLAKRVFSQIGSFDFVLLDALYATVEDIKLHLSFKCVPLIKVEKKDLEKKEMRLKVLQEADEIFDRHIAGLGDDPYHPVFEDEGFDKKRKCNYKIMLTLGLTFPGIEEKFIVAKIEEEYLQRKGDNRFSVAYLIVPILEEKRKELYSIPLNSYRELLHKRWFIENEGFRQFSSFAHSKHIFSKELNVAYNLLLLLFIIFSLFMLFTRLQRRNGSKVYFGPVHFKDLIYLKLGSLCYWITLSKLLKIPSNPNKWYFCTYIDIQKRMNE